MTILGEPALLLPIHVDALAVGAQPRDERFQWTRLSPSYERLEDDFFLGPELAGDPFDQASPLPSGVHLHFRLPRAFAQGRLRTGSPLTFPAIPDRWLVQRILAQGGSRSLHRAWLIRSEQRVSSEGVAWPSFDGDAVSVVRIGGTEELNAPPVQDEKERSDLQLTAVGVGRAGGNAHAADLLFSAHYCASRTVLGFHDELSDVTGDAKISYLVTGWFSRADDDPLWLETQRNTPARWKDLQSWFEERKWTCSESEEGPAPRRVLCHGFVRGLQWKGADHDYFQPLLRALRPARPAAGTAEKPPDAAIGETAAEALAALLRGGEVEQDLLAALQEGLFEDGATVAKLRCDLHSRRFDAVPGGAAYTLAREAEPVSNQNQAAPTPAALPPELVRRLNELNRKQAELDQAARRFEHCGLQLYMTWFLLTSEQKLGENAVKIAALRQRLEACRNEYNNSGQQQQNAVSARDLLLPPGTDDERIWTESDPGATDQFRVTRTPAAAFYSPCDPAIAFAGPVVARRGTAERAQIECRPESRVLQNVNLPVRGGNEATVTAEQVVRDLFGAVPATLDPLHLSLLGEALLLDPGNAARITGLAKVPAGTGGFGNAEFWTTGKFAGRLPDSISQFDRSGENPWIPLIVAWEVQWRPDRDSGYANQAPADAVTRRWSIGEDAEFGPAAASVEPSSDYRIRGQTLLLAGAAAALRDRLREEAATAPLASELANQDTAVQRLSGFNAALIKRRLSVVLPALDWCRYSKGEGLHIDPIQKVLTADEAPLRLAPECREDFPALQAVRAGSLNVLRLSIVDAFGQTIQLMTPEAPTADFKLRAAHSCRGSDGEIVLRPRLLQPARLRLDWDNPICGWIVPNHLDQSFTVHDAEGQALGVLQKRMGQSVGTEDRAAFYWADAPGKTGSLDRIPDPHLQAFRDWVEGLNPDAGSMLFSLISEQIDTADQRTPDTDGMLSTVIGRPLALARGSLRLELAGTLAHPPETGDSRGLEHVCWPIRLGDRRASDDGLVGFFLPKAGGFDRGAFFPAWRPTMTPMSQNLKQRFPDQADLAIDAVQPLPFLALMDPEATLRVATGALPVTMFRFPPDISEGRRRAREAFFLTAPVLGFAEEPEMPRPSDDYGEWSWLWRPSVTAWKAADHLVEAAERGGFDDRWPRISEGWLQLRIEPLKLLSFWVQDTDKPVARGSRPRLAWSQQGAERLELSTVAPQRRSVKVWEKPPFPSAYVVEVHEQTTFELKASSDEIEQSLQLIVMVR